MTDGYRQRVGARIRRARSERGLTQAALARELRVPDNYVSNWERGVNMPSPKHLEALERALEVPAEGFLHDRD